MCRQVSEAALESGHVVLVLISEVWGGFSPEAMRFLGELAQARNDGVDLERASATWSTSSFTSYHGQLLSLAVQTAVGGRDRDRSVDQDERPLLLKSYRVRHGALGTLGPGSPGC